MRTQHEFDQRTQTHQLLVTISEREAHSHMVAQAVLDAAVAQASEMLAHELVRTMKTRLGTRPRICPFGRER